MDRRGPHLTKIRMLHAVMAPWRLWLASISGKTQMQSMQKGKRLLPMGWATTHEHWSKSNLNTPLRCCIVVHLPTSAQRDL